MDEPVTAVLPPSWWDTKQTDRQFAAAPTGRIEAENAVAVLPFMNMSPERDAEYFSDGLAEELLNALSKIRGLRVAARTSSFSFKGRQATVSEIGRVLNVASVLEGSVRMAGDRIRISVQLVKAADGYHLWSKSYDRTLDDIFAVQDDIANSVVEELREMLLGTELDPDATIHIVNEVADAFRGRPADPEAQRLMFLGRFFLDRTTKEDTARAIGYFNEALAVEARYALCWAELGRAYSIQAGRAWVPVEQGFELSRKATERSLELDPRLAEGYAQLGRIQLVHDWDFRAAEESYSRALELAPGNTSVLDGASVLAYKLGRLDEALKLSRQVLVHDPLSAAFWHNLGLAAHAAGRLAESEKAFRRALDLAPQRFVSAALLALVLLDQGRTDRAIVEATKEPDDFWCQWSLAIIYTTCGQSEKADDALRTLTEKYSEGNAYQIAEVYSMSGELDDAFEWLDTALGEKDPGVTHSMVNPRFRPLHRDPRWAAFIKKVGFDT